MQSFDPPIVHGHLTPFNIFIEEGKVLIADYGFEPLTKYAALFGGYRNKSSYTAPELLSTKGNAVTGSSATCDIYSLGMIMWYCEMGNNRGREMYAKKEPFKVTEKELKEYVVDGDYRPQMAADTPKKMKELIRSCWQKDPGKRPGIKEVAAMCSALNS